MTIEEYLTSQKAADDVRACLTLPDGEEARDLGEAVRALRLRTGCTASEATTALRRVVDAMGGVACAEFCLEAYDPDVPLSGVDVDDLPRAVCAVLLADHRVANRNPESGT